MEVRLVGAGSTVKLNGAYFADGTQQLDYDTQQFHEAPNAMSDLSFRGALADTGSVVWRGMIDVADGAPEHAEHQQVDAHQQQRVGQRPGHAEDGALVLRLQVAAEEIEEELEQFRKDYPDEDELFSIIADYIEQVAEEASYGS